MDVVALAQSVGCKCAFALAVRPRVGEQHAVSVVKEWCGEARDTFPVVGYSMQHQDVASVRFLRTHVPGLKQNPISGGNLYILKFGSITGLNEADCFLAVRQFPPPRVKLEFSKGDPSGYGKDQLSNAACNHNSA